jgi:hypothetical protein
MFESARHLPGSIALLMIFNTLLQRLAQLIQPHRVQQLAKQHGWRKRAGKISAFEFLFSCLGQGSALELTLNAQASSFSQPVTRQALDQRYNPAAVEFFKAAFEETLAATLAWKTDSVMTQMLRQRFPAVRLFDSTHCSCSEALAKIFPGCGGDGSAAGFKVLLSYDYGAGQLHPLLVLPAKCSDQGLALTAAQQIHQAELGIFDKGFYKAQALRLIGERGGYFLLPCPHSVSIRQLEATGQPQAQLDLATHLKASTQAAVEWSAVQLGQTELSRLGPVRLIAHRLPEDKANRQRAKLRESCRTQGRQPTQQALDLAGWLILLTNAPAQLLPMAAISYLYRVRWQIELVFKQWKSVLRLNVLSSQNVSRVQCEVWARLLAALLTFVWYQHANIASLQSYEREISFSKVAKQLQQHGQTLVRTLFTGRERIPSEFRSIWNNILKLARKERQPSRPTTWENLCTHWLASAQA